MVENMGMNPHDITKQFEQRMAEYTGAPYAVALDNCSNALNLALDYWMRYLLANNRPLFQEYISRRLLVFIPERTYPSVPCEIRNVGLHPKFDHVDGDTITGEYNLYPTNVWDSALRLTSGMYRPGQLQCLSFTGPYKHLKLSKGGMILTDDEAAYKWFKKMRFSGRSECSYHEDNFDEDGIIGRNWYMMPEIAARGLLLMTEFPEHNKDITMKYPNLSQFKCYTK